MSEDKRLHESMKAFQESSIRINAEHINAILNCDYTLRKLGRFGVQIFYGFLITT